MGGPQRDTPADGNQTRITPSLFHQLILIERVRLEDCAVLHRLILKECLLSMDFLGGSDSKESACNVGDLGSVPGQEDPRRRGWQPTPVFLPGESPGQRSLVGYSPWDCQESDRTEQQTLSISLHKLRLRLPFSFKTKCNFPSVSQKTVTEKTDNKEMD